MRGKFSLFPQTETRRIGCGRAAVGYAFVEYRSIEILSREGIFGSEIIFDFWRAKPEDVCGKVKISRLLAFGGLAEDRVAWRIRSSELFLSFY